MLHVIDSAGAAVLRYRRISMWVKKSLAFTICFWKAVSALLLLTLGHFNTQCCDGASASVRQALVQASSVWVGHVAATPPVSKVLFLLTAASQLHAPSQTCLTLGLALCLCRSWKLPRTQQRWTASCGSLQASMHLIMRHMTPSLVTASLRPTSSPHSWMQIWQGGSAAWLATAAG